MRNRYWIFALVCLLFGRPTSVLGLGDYEVLETDGQIAIVTPQIEASIAKQGYVSGVRRQSLLDKKTGFRDPATGTNGPWLAGMTLAPAMVHEAWCHQRGYVCMIEEIGGQPIKRGESFQAAFIVGYFDSISEMRQVYDQYKGHTGLEVTASEWKLLK